MGPLPNNASLKVNRRPDLGVANAIGQIQKHNKFKRMMMFGLRSLSGLCVPPTTKYKENALAALDEGIVGTISETFKLDPSDEDCAVFGCRIFWGMTEGLKEEGNPSLNERFVREGGVDTLVLLIGAGIRDEAALDYVFKCIKNIADLGVKIDSYVPLVAGIVRCLDFKPKSKTCLQLMSTLASIVGSSADAAEHIAKEGISSILGYCVNMSANDKYAAELIEQALKAVEVAARSGKASPENLTATMTLIDMYKTRKTIGDRGSAVMAAMMGPEQLKKCLDTLSSSRDGSDEKKTALTMLSSMSYIGSYAEAVVKVGSLPLLCDALQRATADIVNGSSDPRVIAGLIGACKMLAKIASDPRHIRAVEQAGGLQAVMTTLAGVKGKPEAAAACFAALSPMSQTQSLAQKMMEKDAIALVLETMQKNSKSIDLLGPAASVLAGVSSHGSIAGQLFKMGVVPLITASINVSKSVDFQIDCVATLEHLSLSVKSAKALKEGDTLKAVVQAIDTHPTNPILAASASAFFAHLATLPDASSMAEAGIVEVILPMMLSHPDVRSVQDNCKAVLEVISTDGNVARALADLEKALMAAKNSPGRAFKALAAVGGLSQITHLRPIFDKQNASDAVLKGIEGWIEGGAFKDQQQMIASGLQCVHNLKDATSGSLDIVCQKLLQNVLAVQMKGMLDRQDPLDNNALDILRSVQSLASLNRIEGEEVLTAVIESVLKVMKRYPDMRHIHVCCINILNELISQKGGTGAFSQTGAIKVVLAYMQKVAMYEDVQFAGFRLLYNCLKLDPSMADVMKRNGGVEVVKSATRTYGKVRDVKVYLSPVAALLMPEDDLEKEILEHLRIIQKGVTAEDIVMILRSMRTMSQLTVSPAGSRCAIRLGVAPECCKVLFLCATLRSKSKRHITEFQDLLAETTTVMKSMTETRRGCLALLKANAIEAVCICIDELTTASSCDAKKDGLYNCAQILRTLMKADPFNSGEVAFNKGVISRMLKLMETYPNDDAIFGSSCSAVAALRYKQLASLPEYRSFLDKVVAGISAGERDRRLQYISALEDLIVAPDMATMESLMNKKCVDALFKAIDDFADDPSVLARAQHCIEEISKNAKMREKWLKEEGNASLPIVISVIKRVIKKNKSDPDACAISIKILHRYTTPGDKSVLQQSGIADDIEELIALHPDHQPLLTAVGEFLGSMACEDLINKLMKQIIDTVQKGAPDWQNSLESLCKNLAVYLNADIEDPDKAFALSPQCADALAQALKKNPNVPTMAATMKVSRRLIEKFWDNKDSPYGAKSIQPNMMAEIARVIGEGDGNTRACRSKKLLCDGLRTLAGCLNNPETRGPALDAVRKNGLIPKCDDFLKMYANDETVVARVLDFMAHVAEDEPGANALVAQFKVRPRSRNIGEELVSDVSAIMARNRKSPALTTAGMELISNILKNATNLPSHLTNPAFLKDLDAIGDASPEALAALMGVKSRLIGKLSNDEICMQLKNTFSRWLKMQEDETISAEQKAFAAAALAKMIGEFADAGLMDGLKKAGAVDILTKILEENPNSLPVLNAVTKTSRKLAQDGDMSAKLMRQNGDVYMKDCVALVDGDTISSQELTHLLKALCETEGNGRLLAQNQNFKNLVDNLKITAANAPGAEGKALKDSITALSKMVEDDIPELLTLKKVFDKWSSRLESGETLNLDEATVVLTNFDFVVNYTEEYSKQSHENLETERGAELMYGCKCFQLLHQYPENTKRCLEKREPAIMIAAIKKQTNEHVDQYPILASADACQHKEGAAAFAAVNEAALVIADALRRGRSISASDAEREELLIPRLLLVERVAFERVYFNFTDAMAALIGLWDDYDAGKYSTILLRHVFRAMRQIVNDHFVPILLKREIPKRLIEVINKKNADLELLPDVLFLLGTLAVVPEIKTMIGELKGIEACLDLIRRCLKDVKVSTSRVQTNACLALANITIGHGPNIAKFTAAKGQDLNVEVLQKSMAKAQEYDIANGASILMCNTCFKRDDQKEFYGKKGAPDAVMQTIKKYDGSDDATALRCLNSMFKAIGNLALYPPNVTEFLEHGIEHTLVHFYKHCENTPDHLIETSLRTVSNLVMENTEAAMIRFGMILEPLLKMLQKGNRDTVSMLSMCFETLGCLCRLPENSRRFAKKQGIETVLKILNNECDESLYSNGIFVLGIQTTNPASVNLLITNGIFTFLVALFEQQVSKISEADQLFEGGGCMATELVISGLRCVRRLLTDRNSCTEFINAGGLTALCRLAGKTDDHPMIHLECHRAIINLLELFPPPEPIQPKASPKEQDEWDAPVMDEGVLAASVLVDRPPSPRAWESVGLQPIQVSDLIVNICTILSKEENAKQLRLARFGLGLLAYFACEKIENTVESFYNAGVPTVIELNLASFEGESSITLTCCHIINNVCFASDAKMYALMRKEKKMRVNLEFSNKVIPKVEKRTKEFCILTEKLLNEKILDPTRFSVHQQWDYPLSLTLWDKDPYPNGVQDLPIDMREEIRAGGKFKLVVDDKIREVFYWRASFDMLNFQWRIDPKEGTYPNAVPAARIKTISRGLASETFKRAAAKSSGVHRLNDGSCCVLAAPPGSNLPEGAELNIICGSRKARDRFVALISEWRDAATFGF